MNLRPSITKTIPHALSAARRRLLALCRDIQFGRVEEFDIRDGEPVLDPALRVVREIKFNGENTAQAKRDGDIPLRNQTAELFAWFDRLGNAHVHYLEIKHGLPFKMNVLHDPDQPR